MALFNLFILFGCAFLSPASADVIQLHADNIDNILATYELVFINFYVDWCHYSRLMQPVFEEATKLVEDKFGDNGRVAMCRVDCDSETGIAKRFKITKYPTLKLSLNGDVMKREYRGQRKAEAVYQFVKDQLDDPIKVFTTLNELKNLDSKKRVVIAYFAHHDDKDYDVYRRVAANLKDECEFYAGFGEAVSEVHDGERPTIVFRPDTDRSHEHDEIYNGTVHPDELKIWAQERCIPLVREITFENAEELTEEGMPFMILFYDPNDTAPIKDYKTMVESELIAEKQNINFLIADGKRFAHPLEHLNKRLEDLPVIAIDSFRHMYLFPDFKLMFKPGRLKKFVADLHSGKLHREFHYGPEDETEEENEISDHADEHKSEHKSEHEPEHTPEHKSEHESEPKSKPKSEHRTERAKISSENEIDDDGSPPDSTFVKLAPSEKRYTLLRNEL